MYTQPEPRCVAHIAKSQKALERKNGTFYIGYFQKHWENSTRDVYIIKKKDVRFHTEHGPVNEFKDE